MFGILPVQALAFALVSQANLDPNPGLGYTIDAHQYVNDCVREPRTEDEEAWCSGYFTGIVDAAVHSNTELCVPRDMAYFHMGQELDGRLSALEDKDVSGPAVILI